MIKFFRKIRQKLLAENPPAGPAEKFSKYLVYAVGEIILVVIGILIALQINNWNENRKEAITELAILNEIKSALKTDLQDLEANSNSYARRTKSHDFIIHWLQGDQGFQDSLQTSIGFTSSNINLIINQNAYENLKQLGMRSVTSDTLRFQITHLYEEVYKKYVAYNEDLNSILKDVNTDYAKYFNGSYSMSILHEKILINNIENLKNDFSFIYHQRKARMLCWLLNKGTTPEVTSEINKTIEMIDNELKSRI